jgi:DNA-binding CsgD family transcriptional regulator
MAPLDQKQFITIRDGRLGAVDPNGNHKIDALLHRIATGKVRSGEIIVGDSVKSWHVSAFRVSDQSTTAIRSIGCHIWVWITDLANMRDSLTSRLNSFFHLTPAELRVALSLEKGLSAKDIAGLNQVSVTTVRSQIQSVFSKTGVNRQSELVALLAKLGGTPRR